MKKFLIFLFLACAVIICGCSRNDYDPARPPDVIEGQEKDSPLELEIPEPYPPDVTLTFAGCGDNIMYNGTIRDAESVAVEGGRKYNFDFLR